jgi:hypothetical protein
LLVVGCSVASGSVESEQDLVPDGVGHVCTEDGCFHNYFEQAPVCSEVIARHRISRRPDLKEGTIRWACADVPGVTAIDPAKCAQGPVECITSNDPALPAVCQHFGPDCEGFGQEYCEFHAIANGKVITKVDEAAGSPIACVFTSIFPQGPGIPALQAAMASSENLGTAAATNEVVQMQLPANGRLAADKLIAMNHRAAQEEFRDKLTNEVRQTACWQASASDPAKKERLAQLCTGRDLAREDSWKPVEELGAKVLAPSDPGYDDQRDIAACLATSRSGGAPWRNSDNVITGRIVRAAEECSCNWSPLPDDLLGFPLGGWVNDQQLPHGCRYAKVDGKDHPSLVLCDLSGGDAREDLSTSPSKDDLQALCHERFSRDIVVRAPVRAAQIAGSCREATPFCSQFLGR